MRASWLLPVAVLTIPMVSACSSQGGVQNAPLHAGVNRTYTAAFDKVLALARESMVEAKLQIENANQVDANTWMIMAKAGTSAFSWGEIVRCVVIKDSPTTTSVWVYTKRKSTLNVTAKGDYSQAIFSNIELKLRSTPS